ncbi:MAG: hypothetical protein GY953_36530, partial [bacterium]|nr:hypothetical protein [bacterium]
LLPTFCALAGVEKPLPKGIEGGDFSHLLTGSKDPVKRPREELVFHFPHYQGDTPHSAIFLGGHKAIKFYESGELKLFDIARDIGESNDLANKMPEKAAAMEKRLTAYLKDVGAGLPKPNSEAVKGKVYTGKGGKMDKTGGGKRGADAKESRREGRGRGRQRGQGTGAILPAPKESS